MLKSNLVKITACILVMMMMVPAGLVIMPANDQIIVVPAAEVVDDSVDTIVIQPNATVGKDTYISNDTALIDPSWNFGEDQSLYIGAVNTEPINGLIEFDLPANVGNLNRATLSLYSRSIVGTPGNLSVYGVSNDWEEGTGGASGPAGIANWSYRLPPLVPWTTPGGDYIDTEDSYIEVTQLDTWYSWNVTSIVQNWKSGAWSNYGFFIKSENAPNVGTNYAAFHSTDYTVDTNLTPKLTLTYSAEIDPPVPPQTFTEDDPPRSIVLDNGNGSVVHVSGPDDIATAQPFFGTGADWLHFMGVYTPEQVGSEGVIRKISLNRTNSVETGVFNDVVISLAHTSQTDLVTTAFTDNHDGYLVEVFNEATVVLNSSDGDSWIHFDLNDNFTYDASHNLIVDIQWNGDDGNSLNMDSTNFGTIKSIWESNAAPGTINTIQRTLVTRFTTDAMNNAIIDDGRMGNGGLFDSADTYKKFQILYNVTDMGNQSGIIDKIGFYKPNVGISSFPNFTISVAHSDNDTISSTFSHNYIGSLTDVYFNVNFTHNDSTGWVEFDVDDKFDYDGVHNLLVQVEWSGTAYGPVILLHRGPPAATPTNNYWARTNIQGSLTGSTSNVYYNINILYHGSANLTWSVISNTPDKVTASVSGSTLSIAPVENAYGDATLTLTLTNAVSGDSISQTIDVTIVAVNDEPLLSGPASLNGTEDIEFSVNMTQYVTDIDSDINNMTYTTDSDYATVNGSVITFLYPEGITEELVTITVTDTSNGQASVIVPVTITPVNDAPELDQFVDTLVCDATVAKTYTVHPKDEETVTGNLTIYTSSSYATVTNHMISFLYPKGIGSEDVTIYVVDGNIYGSQNNITYILAVTINDHPEIISHSPVTANNTTVAVTTVVVVEFDMSMNTTETQKAFNMTLGTTVITGTFSWSGNSTTMTFTPSEALTNGVYDVMVKASAESADGHNMFSAFSWNFTAALGSYDRDGDGMPDQYELDNGLDPDVNDADADLDGDGMPNLYEYQNDLDPAVNDAEADADGDGATNLEEYEADTDPNDQNDKPSEPMSMGLLFIIIIIVVVVIMLFVMKGRGSKAPPEQQPQQDWGQQEQEQQFDEPQEDAPVEEQYQEPEYTEPAEPAEPQDAEQPPPPPPQDDGDISQFITEE